MAGMDTTLLALAGAGYPGRRSFGFASCERVVGAAEGMNVLAQQRRPAGTPPEQHGSDGGGGASRAASAGAAQHVRRDHSGASWAYRVTNVEYTEFERLGLADESVDEASNVSVFPANTNVLYVGLPVSLKRLWGGGGGGGGGGARAPGEGRRGAESGRRGRERAESARLQPVRPPSVLPARLPRTRPRTLSLPPSPHSPTRLWNARCVPAWRPAAPTPSFLA